MGRRSRRRARRRIATYYTYDRTVRPFRPYPSRRKSTWRREIRAVIPSFYISRARWSRSDTLELEFAGTRQGAKRCRHAEAAVQNKSSATAEGQRSDADRAELRGEEIDRLRLNKNGAGNLSREATEQID